MGIPHIGICRIQHVFKPLHVYVGCCALFQCLKYYLVCALYHTITGTLRISYLYLVDAEQSTQDKLKLLKHSCSLLALLWVQRSLQLLKKQIQIPCPLIRWYHGSNAQLAVVQAIVTPELCSCEQTGQVVIKKLLVYFCSLIKRTLAAAWAEYFIVLLLRARLPGVTNNLTVFLCHQYLATYFITNFYSVSDCTLSYYVFSIKNLVLYFLPGNVY